jgi:PAS domain S-box-containing protein
VGRGGHHGVFVTSRGKAETEDQGTRRPTRPRWHFGIRGKLVVAVSAVAAMTLLAGVITWFGYSEIERLLSNVTRTNLPSLASALKLSEATARLAAAAPVLDGARSQFQRQSNFIALQQQTERLLGLIDTLEGVAADSAAVEELRSMVTAIGDNVLGRNALVDRRLQLVDRTRTAGDFLGRLERDIHVGIAQTNADPTLIVVFNALGLLREAFVAIDVETVTALRRDYDEQAHRLAVLVEATGQGRTESRARDSARQVLTLGGGPDNVFELRSLHLLTLSRLQSANEEGRDLVARTSSSVGRLVSHAEAEASRNEHLAEAVLSHGRRTLLLIAMCMVVGPLLFVWLYLGRNIVARLTGLANSMHRIADGDFHSAIAHSGHDEISDMAAELVVFRDAMARVQASTSALMESERRLRRILDTSPLALAISRVSDNALIYVNPRWSELFLVNEGAAGGMDAASFYAEARERIWLVDLVHRIGFVSNHECLMRSADGHKFWAMLSAAEIEMDGEPAIIVTTSDISRRKEAEAALAEAKQVAEEASQAKSLFLATMSHEIRTPMNGVLTMAQLLEEMHLPPEQQEMARVIRDSATSLLTIINDILDFSKIESGKLQLEAVELSLADVVEGVAEMLAPRAQEKGVGIMTFIDPSLPERLIGDPVRLRQIITNLAANAIKFTDRGYVHITVEAIPGSDAGLHLKFSVIDTGIGLDTEQQARLFEPFSQADASISRRYGGTGLGLSICRHLVAMMQGEIGVGSRRDEGSTFWFTVPLGIAVATPEPGPDLAGIAVLVLAEGPVAAEGIRQYLGHLGAQVAVVASTDGALAAVRAASLAGWSYDVVLMDGTDDVRLRITVARALLAAAGSTAQTRVVMVAPHPSFASAARAARAAGLFATLPKPVRRWELWRITAAAAGRASLETDEDEHLGMDEIYLAPSVSEAAAAGALILVAEDNPTNQVVIRRLMDRLGYAIELAANGVEAWERMQIRDYGLLLTDCHMPEMDGYELTQRVREWEESTCHRMPIVALTADALAGTARRCQECGMDAFLAKPVDLPQLDGTIRRLLPRAVALRRRRVAPVVDAVEDAGPEVAAAVVDQRENRLPILDLATMHEIFGGITEEARELLQLFVDSTEPLVGEAAVKLAAGDIIGAREAAHAAKGAGNSAGAFRFASLCAEMESACARGDTATAAALTEPAAAAFRDAVAAVAAL